MGRALQGNVLVAARQPGQMPSLRRIDEPQSQALASFIAQPFYQRQTPIDPTLVTTEHLSDFDLLKSILNYQSIDDPGFFEFNRSTRDPIEVEDRGFSALLIRCKESTEELLVAFKGSGGTKTLEAIDEHRLSIQLADNDRRQLAIVSKRLEHLLLKLGLSQPITL